MSKFFLLRKAQLGENFYDTKINGNILFPCDKYFVCVC
jgi:hypothetical protein